MLVEFLAAVTAAAAFTRPPLTHFPMYSLERVTVLSSIAFADIASRLVFAVIISPKIPATYGAAIDVPVAPP